MEPTSNLGGTHEEDPFNSASEPQETTAFTEQEREDGLDGARFSYLFNFFGMPFCLIPLLKREHAYSLFHAKQAFLLWCLFFCSLFTGWVLCWISLKALWIFALGGGLSLGLNVMGYQRLLEEDDRPLPGVGPLAEAWLSGVVLQDEDGDSPA